MADSTPEPTEDGTITVLLQRMVNQRLPRALELKKFVDGGGCLSELDIQFLERVFNDAGKASQHIHLKDHPELAELASKMAGLYEEITAKALENERNKK